MANDVQISIKDEASARAWLANVTLLNEDYHTAMQEAGQTLEDMENFAEGTVVDDFVDLGSKILNAAKSTYEAIGSIADTVNTVIEKTKDFVSEAAGVIGKVISIFG